jgi:MiaB/RimO family radical SAM methylthiotransferase
VAVIFTCGVSTYKEQMSLDCLDWVVADLPPGAQLLVAGCLPQISPWAMEHYPVFRTFSPRTLGGLVAHMQSILPFAPACLAEANRSLFDDRQGSTTAGQSTPREEYDRAKRGFKIRIARGCSGSCSYCAIRAANGRLESVPLPQIIQQVHLAVKHGEPTIMLMAGDTSVYGEDVGSDLVQLLAQVLAVGGRFRLFIHDLGPAGLLGKVDRLVDAVEQCDSSAVLRALCMPVQSGNDEVLRRMRRGYTALDVSRMVDKLRTIRHPPLLGTHVLVGFPGETEQEFGDTVAFLQQMRFDFVTCFPYSEHPAATSSRMQPKIADGVVQQRLQQIKFAVASVKTMR